jgi:hypothetical protein
MRSCKCTNHDLYAGGCQWQWKVYVRDTMVSVCMSGWVYICLSFQFLSFIKWSCLRLECEDVPSSSSPPMVILRITRLIVVVSICPGLVHVGSRVPVTLCLTILLMTSVSLVNHWLKLLWRFNFVLFLPMFLEFDNHVFSSWSSFLVYPLPHSLSHALPVSQQSRFCVFVHCSGDKKQKSFFCFFVFLRISPPSFLVHETTIITRTTLSPLCRC